jgi:hypothetical protein
MQKSKKKKTSNTALSNNNTLSQSQYHATMNIKAQKLLKGTNNFNLT